MTAQRAISLCSPPGYEGGRGFKHVQKRRHNKDYDALLSIGEQLANLAHVSSVTTWQPFKILKCAGHPSVPSHI
jgi:hypothetical protein